MTAKNRLTLASDANTTLADNSTGNITAAVIRQRLSDLSDSAFNLTDNTVPGVLGYTPENAAYKGVANGYAGLDSSGQVPASQLPAATGGLPVRYDAAQSLTSGQQAQARANIGVGLPSIWFRGLDLSNDGTSPNTKIQIAAGEAYAGGLPTSTAGFSKTTAAFVAGTANGGLDTGSVAASATYHVFALIKNADLTFDALLSVSATAPTVPSGYTLGPRVGSILTDGSSNIRAFSQLGREFLLATPLADASTGTLSTTATLFTLTVPAGIKVDWIGDGSVFHASGSAVLVSSPDATDQATTTNGLTTVQVVANAYGSFSRLVRTSTSRQIRARASAASTTLQLNTHGWLDISLPKIG